MIADVARLGYLDGSVCDATWGRGTFWKRWAPERLTAHDLFTLDGVDFTDLPEADATYDAFVLDGPYRLNGKPDPAFDARYGTNSVTSWQDRHALIRAGMTEGFRVTKPQGFVLVKGQAQVCSGAVRWQDREFADHGESLGGTLVDRFDLLGTARDQPERTKRPERCAGCAKKRGWDPAPGTLNPNLWQCRACGYRQLGPPVEQQHAHGRPSFLLVFRTPVFEAPRLL